VLERRRRLDRLARLRYAHKLVLAILIVLGVVAALLAIAQDQETLEIESAYGADEARFPAYVAALVGADATGGNTYQVLDNGDEIFPAMLAAIDGAATRISFETYIFEKGQVGDRFVDALVRAAGRGVQVNLVVDAIGSKQAPAGALDRLRAAGAKVGDFGAPRWYSLEEVNYRTHRKILVVDGAIAFTGGVGVADQWLGHAQGPGHWRDMMVRVQGPLARLMEAAFDENFVETLGPAEPPLDPPGPLDPASPSDSAFVVRSSPTGGANDLKRLYMLAIASARRSLDICSPYFVTDESSEWALAQAVKRGVRIRILVEGDLTDAKPVKYASRDAYTHLMQEGIEIYEYQPTMMHTKAMIVDDSWSMIGSANFDNRSLELNDEMNVGISDRGLAARLRRGFEDDLRRARKLDLQTWRRRGLLEKARERFWSYFGEVF
jgi:cardiolipin synthase